MNCPKCKKQLQEQGIQCPHCGIYFAKYAQYHTPPTEQPNNITVYEEEDVHPIEKRTQRITQ
jgi:ribosomal protein L37AE/L43A